jgi:hypothetical protein
MNLRLLDMLDTSGLIVPATDEKWTQNILMDWELAEEIEIFIDNLTLCYFVRPPH